MPYIFLYKYIVTVTICQYSNYYFFIFTLMDTNDIISSRIISILKKNNLKRELLADLIGENKFKLDNYLQGKAKWDINFVVKICDVFEISVDDLIKTNYVPPLSRSTDRPSKKTPDRSKFKIVS